MSGIEIALIAGAATSAGGALFGAMGTQAQAGANKSAIALQREGLALQREQMLVQRDSQALQARDQELVRRRRAQLADGSLDVAALAAGLDPGSVGTIGVIRNENDRALDADLAAIQMGASSAAMANTVQQRQGLLQDRSLALQSAVWSQSAQTGWLKAGFQMVQAGAGLYRSSAFGVPGAAAAGAPQGGLTAPNAAAPVAPVAPSRAAGSGSLRIVVPALEPGRSGVISVPSRPSSR